MRIDTVTGRHAAIIGTLLALVAAGCSGSPTTPPNASHAASPASTTTASTGSSAPKTPSATPAPTPADTPVPSVNTGTCPTLPVDLATVRDFAKAGRALACFATQELTFRGYVPTTDSLGGVPASKMTPGWIADPWTGVILQPAPLAQVDQSTWFVVRVSPALGKCSVTDIQAAHCPFGTYLDKYVTVTGHFNDGAAPSCKSAALPGQTDPGPSKSKMVARCRREFVVTAIAAG